MILPPIIIVEDDEDDTEMLMQVLLEIGIPNKIICFDSAEKALNFLRNETTQPLVVISDINMPKMNGIEFKRAINTDKSFHDKRIPFVFLSTSASAELVDAAYKLAVHGFFKKPHDIKSLRTLANVIIGYWGHNKFATIN